MGQEKGLGRFRALSLGGADKPGDGIVQGIDALAQQHRELLRRLMEFAQHERHLPAHLFGAEDPGEEPVDEPCGKGA